VTKHQLKNAARRARDWRKCNKQSSIAACRRWRDKNPGWWRGRRDVQLLTNALIRHNAHAKVFMLCGITLDAWIDQAPCLKNGGLGALIDGAKMVPIKSWLEFDLNDPMQRRVFLAPTNFRIIPG